MSALTYQPFDPTMLIDPYPQYERLRQESPVHYVATEDLWVVSRYAEVLGVLRDPAGYSSAGGMGKLMKGKLGPARNRDSSDPARLGIDMTELRILIATDPPDHTRLRRLVGTAFTPRVMAALEPSVRAICESLVDDLLAGAGPGGVDLVSELAWPLPVIVIAELLGVPGERRAEFKHWSDDLVGGITGVWEREGMQESALAMFEYFSTVVAERTAHSGDDLISRLVTAGAQGDDPLSAMEVVVFCVLLLVAGNETTTNLLGNTVAALWAHPDQAERLARQPQLVAAAFEEALRYDSPVQALFRTTTRPATIAGRELPVDANVMVLFGSANRDEQHFGPDAGKFRIDRNPSDHVGFGSGIHLCLGAHLARLEARVMGEVLLERVAALEPAGDAERTGGFILRGFRRLPVTVRPR